MLDLFVVAPYGAALSATVGLVACLWGINARIVFLAEMLLVFIPLQRRPWWYRCMYWVAMAPEWVIERVRR